MSLFGRRRDEELDEEIEGHLRMAARDPHGDVRRAAGSVLDRVRASKPQKAA